MPNRREVLALASPVLAVVEAAHVVLPEEEVSGEVRREDGVLLEAASAVEVEGSREAVVDEADSVGVDGRQSLYGILSLRRFGKDVLVFLLVFDISSLKTLLHRSRIHCRTGMMSLNKYT